MTRKLLAGATALAFFAGIGAASAQSGMQQQERSSPGAAPSQSQDGQKQPEGRSQDGSGRQTQSPQSGEKPGAAGTQDVEKKAQQGTQQNQRQGQQDRDGATQRQGQQDRNGANQRQTRDRDGDKRDGQAQRDSQSGGGKANVELNSDQRTRISQTIKTQNVRRVTNVNFNISVGTRVPRGAYTYYPIPATIVSFVPAYRGYLYLVVGDEMLIIHPRTYEIVAVIPV